jgi:hypothetical protein
MALKSLFMAILNKKLVVILSSTRLQRVVFCIRVMRHL